MSADVAGTAVPPALAARMDELLRAYGEGRQDADALTESAVLALSALSARDPAMHTALDLLAIDGLITAAFASAGDGDLERHAGDAATRLMALGDLRA